MLIDFQLLISKLRIHSMKILNFTMVFCLLFIGGSLIGTTFCSANEVNVNFPKKIVYKIYDDRDQYVGECTLKFSKKGKRTSSKTYTLTLSDFVGLGFSSDEVLLTDIYKKDLSIYSIILTKKGSRVPMFEARAIDGDGIMSTTEKTYRFKAQDKSGTLDTGLYSKHKVIDLLSSFVMASQMVRTKQSEADFYFFIKEISRVVKMKKRQGVKLKIEGRNVNTVPVSLLHQPKGGKPEEIFRFYIDSKDHYPVQVTIPHGKGVITLRKHKRM